MFSNIMLNRTLKIGLLCATMFLSIAVSTPCATTIKTRWSIGPGFGLQTRTGGDDPKYTLSPMYRGSIGRRWGGHWRARIAVGYASIKADSTAGSAFQIGSESNSRVNQLKSWSGSLAMLYFPAGVEKTITPYFGGQVGAGFWSVNSISPDTTLDTLGSSTARAGFDADELTLGALLGIEFRLNKSFSVATESQYNYFTGIGTEFADIVNETRPRSGIEFSVNLLYRFGAINPPEKWGASSRWKDQSGDLAARRAEGRDSDADGVIDSDDRCPGTPHGAQVDKQGCPLDSDGDGVFDGLDDCPDTPGSAMGLVDIYGCPIDSDFDGVPDYADSCADGPVGAPVGPNGCPFDSDKDGVVDGMDDCPGTPSGVVVDQHGCPDLTIFNTPMVLNINYPSGSFELDATSRARLDKLARTLALAPDIRVKIIGYTDNQGTPAGNRELSQKRANRVRDFLLSKGISKDRLTALGRGETNFVADNSTPEGRQANRRIELEFSR